MKQTVIKVEGLGKEYRIGQAETRPDNFREAIVQGLTAPVRRLRQLSGEAPPESEFWALKDVNFEVKEGEVVGVIGHNGAGKSTLLKILSRITTPTRGRALLRGQVSSLLEVGTGFHPELTGRENIFLNGTILGMSQRDIRARFDEIVEFADIEQFINTPIKRYSSGMSVRLAFAVAAHLGTDIMIVDEVLAVGDIAFQRKCMATMSDIAKNGRTVLFVSHNINAIKQLCPRSILMAGGMVAMDDETLSVLQKYLATPTDDDGGDEGDEYADNVLIRRVSIGSQDEPNQNIIAHDQDVHVHIRYRAPTRPEHYRVGFIISDPFGNELFASWETDQLIERNTQSGQLYVAKCTIPRKLLKPGEYILSTMMWQYGMALVNSGSASFTISELGYTFGTRRRGLLAPILHWEVAKPLSYADVSSTFAPFSAKR